MKRIVLFVICLAAWCPNLYASEKKCNEAIISISNFFQWEKKDTVGDIGRSYVNIVRYINPNVSGKVTEVFVTFIKLRGEFLPFLFQFKVDNTLCSFRNVKDFPGNRKDQLSNDVLRAAYSSATSPHPKVQDCAKKYASVSNYSTWQKLPIAGDDFTRVYAYFNPDDSAEIREVYSTVALFPDGTWHSLVTQFWDKYTFCHAVAKALPSCKDPIPFTEIREWDSVQIACTGDKKIYAYINPNSTPSAREVYVTTLDLGNGLEVALFYQYWDDSHFCTVCTEAFQTVTVAHPEAK